MKRLRACAALALVLIACSASAAEGQHAAAHSDGEGVWVLVRHALNLAILGFLLVRFALPALRDFMRQRAQKLREQIDSARQELEMAQRELRQLRAQLERADEDARDLAAEAERAALAEQQRVLERASESGQRLREDARRIADQELERARGLLRAETAGLAAELAATLLRERLTADDDRRLFDEFAERVGSAS